MIVMGVESSCDETGVGIVDWDPQSRTAVLLADEVASSQDEHARYGEWCPRSRRARTSRQSCRRCAAPSPPPAWTARTRSP
ncbi:hypothetical protein MTP03_38440 [Tsukamurella sp. PLM1]|nr:hypothetical protein MTP03_38440 [Tsukamurella sp. PLM1]